MSETPPAASVQAVRLQMELARLLDVPFTADQAALAQATSGGSGWLAPGLPASPDTDPYVAMHLSLSLPALQRLVAVLKASSGDR